ncbi:MAG: hypothetical protein ABSD82_13395 [Solirubrobacteraceae bacterium]|jgi:hypothetical protein
MTQPSAVDGSLFAENVALGERLRRISPVVAGMARDLVTVRREAAALRRENARLRAHVGAIGGEPLSSDPLLCDRCRLAMPAGRADERGNGRR